MGGAWCKTFDEELAEHVESCRRAQRECNRVIQREHIEQEKYLAYRLAAVQRAKVGEAKGWAQQGLRSENLVLNMINVQGQLKTLEMSLRNAKGLGAVQTILKDFALTLRTFNNKLSLNTMQRVVSCFSLETQKLHFKMELAQQGMDQAGEAMDEANTDVGLDDDEGEAGLTLQERASAIVEADRNNLIVDLPSPDTALLPLHAPAPPPARRQQRKKAPAAVVKADDSDSI